jgi:two-component system, chemotaxis family, sensor kinase CheA
VPGAFTGHSRHNIMRQGRGMDNAHEVFREEACELLEELTTTLLALEEQPHDMELVGRAFRALHTIKGSGAMFGFDELSAFVHDIETVFDLVRENRLNVSKDLIDLTLQACDIIRIMVSRDAETIDTDRKQVITAGFARMLAGAQGEEAVDAAVPGPQTHTGTSPDAEAGKRTFRIRFTPAEDILCTGTNPLLLLNELRGLGQCSVFARTCGIPALAELNHEHCYTRWDILLTTNRDIDAIRDVFIFIEDTCTLNIDLLDAEAGDGLVAVTRVGDILLERSEITSDDLRRALQQQKRLGEVLVESGTLAPEAVESALSEQQHLRRLNQEHKQSEAASSIRVAAEKIDALVDLVGEMVTVQARLSQAAARSSDPELGMIAEEVERLTAELRDTTMSVRMLPIGVTFGKFKRVVRDLAAELGKEVILQTDGAETELDKTVIERLGDPLMHLIRNCLDHGIESPDVRATAGKPRAGTVYLSARHSGAHVIIQIDDDGAGLNREAILKKAIEKGIVNADCELSDREVYELIFAAGFSTAQTVTSVSGRGVGMDVVRRNIDALRGTIDIASEPGQGTTITLKLPLTLAIIDGLLVRIANNYYVLQLSAVEECIELTDADIDKAHGKHMIPVRGDLVPYIRLRDHFALEGERPAIEQIVICDLDGLRTGFVVDAVIGSYQTVIKNLGRLYRDIEGLSGATILGDGTVALILDPAKIAAGCIQP